MTEPTAEELQKQIDEMKRQHREQVHDLKRQLIEGRDKRDELDTHNRNLERELEDSKARLGEEKKPGADDGSESTL